MAGGKRGNKSTAALKAPEVIKQEDKLSEQDVYDTIDFELDSPSPQEGEYELVCNYTLLLTVFLLLQVNLVIFQEAGERKDL